MSGRRFVPVVAALVAVVLGAALAGAVTVEPPATQATDGRVGAAGLSRSELPVDQATSRSTETETTVPVTTSAHPAPTSSTPATPPATRTTTTTRSTSATLPPGAPNPLTPPPTGIPDIRPASSWSAERDGVTARLRIDPATPVAGQSVRFFVEASSAEPCCTIFLGFGDDSTEHSVNNGASCGSLPPGSKSLVVDHTYRSPGAYKARLTVMTGFECSPPLAPGASPPIPVFHSVTLDACIAVGPGTSGQGGCSPFPEFGPDSIVSPVLDPFCQVRSDCTSASPPR
ncbi:MAG TPA: hypothetical protein VHF27_06300 [Acidimicrobiales bacterium]|nr:hypothetical protein [Acidimicrobiales bacterium]